jgi:3'-5' exoribonuclease 1
MAGKPEGDEHSEAPESPRGRTDASGLWVTEDVREADPGGRTHPIYKKLASLSSEVNSMSRGQLKQRLRDLDLEPRGTDTIISKRLTTYLRRQAILQEPDPPWELQNSVQTNPYGLQYLLVLDFEATCEPVNPPDYVHEIIEFPVLLFNLKTLTVEDRFHSYCRPFLNPNLTDFCKNLTGIRQDQVDGAPYFTEVFRNFTEWLDTRDLANKLRFSLVTDCPWDIKECLFPQCVLSQVQFPHYATKWIDVRKLFGSFYRTKSGNLSSMLEKIGLKFEGREHCGLHDSLNIARVTERLIRDGCVLKYNRFMPQDLLASFDKS